MDIAYKFSRRHTILVHSLLLIFTLGCENRTQTAEPNTRILNYSKNILDFIGDPVDPSSRDMLMFSDQGGWFAYGLPKDKTNKIGFTGPFLMTQQNGVWSGNSLAELSIVSHNGKIWVPNKTTQNSYASHLEQEFGNDELSVTQKLVYVSPHTALQQTVLTNLTAEPTTVTVQYSGSLFPIGVKFVQKEGHIQLRSEHSKAVGHLQFLSRRTDIERIDSLTYDTARQRLRLAPGGSQELLVAQTFIFPEYPWEKERALIENVDFDTVLLSRIKEKEGQLTALVKYAGAGFKGDAYRKVLAKAMVTLQNNWRVPAGELKHQGLFPSYHYEGFHGFWSWDSWKHAVGLSFFDTDLAKEQIKAMYDFQLEDGFIVDCVYRDTTIEPHNLRDTKPPLSVWAVSKILDKDSDMDFLKEMYPKLKRYHQWWYLKRDHDQDGICEYGSTDGTVIAAKWESGMDNAIRFDDTQMVKNTEGAFSMNQESVDLNAYLYAEKLYLARLAKVLGKESDFKRLNSEAEILKEKIQSQFFDPEDGWFYDTDLSGEKFIKGAGSEGWIPLWAKVATQEQANTIRDKMMDPEKFYVKVPFQTMAKDHPKFDPMNGYWRGPNWLDQSYFGVKGLKNYGFEEEAHKATLQILEGAEGIMEKGVPIRENYHPLTGKGLNAKNFSWVLT